MSALVMALCYSLVTLSHYPKLARRLRRYKKQLVSRSCVPRSGDGWYRTIDRISRSTWRPPKLLVPELAKRPRVALDTSGAIPSHGIYAIQPGAWPIAVLHAALSAGVLGATLHAIAPKVNSECLRSYKKFLVRIPLPKWDAVPDDLKTTMLAAVERRDWSAANAAIAELYGVTTNTLAAFATTGWLGKLQPRSLETAPRPPNASSRAS